MTRQETLKLVADMNAAAKIQPHVVEYVTMVAEMVWLEAEREGRVSALADAQKIVESAA